jgi:hypothetical protein
VNACPSADPGSAGRPRFRRRARRHGRRDGDDDRALGAYFCVATIAWMRTPRLGHAAMTAAMAAMLLVF